MKKQINLVSLFVDVFKVAPLMFCVEYFFTAVDSVALAFIAMAIERFFSNVLSFTQGSIDLVQIIYSLAILAALNVLSEAGSGIASYFGEVYADLSNRRLHERVNEKIGKLYAISFENPKTLDSVNKAYSGASASRQVTNIVMDIFTLYMPYFVIYSVYLYSLRPILAFCVFIVFIPTLLAQVVKSKIFIEREDELAALRRKKEHYANCVSQREYVKETRILGVVSYFFNLYDRTLGTITHLLIKSKRKAAAVDSFAKVLNLLGYAGVLYLLLDSIFKGFIGIGAFVAVFTSIKTVFDLMDELIGSRLGDFSDGYAKLKGYIEFLNLDMPADNGKSVFEHDSIHLDNVCFEYPDGLEVLSNISFAVKKGETVAIVGENGSGKSTLVRLLLGVYLPKSGAIYHNNVNTSDLQYSDMHKNVSAVFQDFKKYKMTLEENVRMGDLSKDERTKVLSSLNISGIDLSEKFDLETNLGREFGGIDLSIGEWQRVAIARGIYRNSDVIAFDEPTASIDPLQEYQLYKAFAEIAQGKIAFIVTHRLSCIKFCDKIIVMRQGKVLYIGSHEKLLGGCPYYKTLWNSQAEMYTETPVS